jgi:hypothetical protein
MRIGGAWVGWGLGDDLPEIRAFKSFLRGKFSYAKPLADSSVYDQQMVDVVLQMQRAYTAQGKLKAATGIVDYATKIACGYIIPKPFDSRPVLFTVCGTGVPWWVGPDADTARAVADRYLWQPIGYPAQPVPMGPSIQAGKDELINQFTIHRERVQKYGAALAGYSQGAIVVGEVWENDIKPATGRAAWIRPFIRKAVTWGNPMREKGQAYPDAGAPMAPADHQGVTGTLMKDTPPWWRNYAHVADLYADCPDDKSGEDRQAIWKVIRDGDMISGPNSLLAQVAELFGAQQPAQQIVEAGGMLKAMLDALVFFGGGTRPHTNYSINEAIAYLKG